MACHVQYICWSGLIWAALEWSIGSDSKILQSTQSPEPSVPSCMWANPGNGSSRTRTIHKPQPLSDLAWPWSGQVCTTSYLTTHWKLLSSPGSGEKRPIRLCREMDGRSGLAEPCTPTYVAIIRNLA
ncbi:hypothetical protein BJX76DRAFT_197212 [Aspergillus varians]